MLSQSALQLNNQDGGLGYSAGYHSNQGLALGEQVTPRSGQVGGAVHSYNQVCLHTHTHTLTHPNQHNNDRSSNVSDLYEFDFRLSLSRYLGDI